MMKSAKKVAVLTISEKLNATMRFKIAALEEIDYLVTELDPSDLRMSAYLENGVQVL